jgi:hypothetical protein
MFLLAAGIFNSVIRPLFKTTGIFLIVILGFIWVVSFIALSAASPFAIRFGPESGLLSYLGWVAILLCVALPMLGIVLWLSGWVFRYNTHAGIRQTLWTVWFVSLFTASYVATVTVKSYSHEKEYTTVSDYAIPNDEIVFVETEEMKPRNFFGIMTPDLRINMDGMKFRNVTVSTVESEDHLLRVERRVSARGADEKEAIRNIEAIQDAFAVEGNEIKMSRFITLSDDARFRGQQVSYTVHIPKGKTVNMDRFWKNKKSGDNIFIGGLGDFETDDRYDSDHTTLTEESDGFISVNSNEEIPSAGYDKIVVSGPGRVIIRYGKKPEIRTSADEKAKDAVSVKPEGQSVAVHFSRSTESVLEIITPDLKMLSLYDVQSAEITGFHADKLKLLSKTEEGNLQARIILNADIRLLDLNAEGPQEIICIGKGDQAEIHLSQGAMLSAGSFSLKNAVLYGTDFRQSELTVTGTVRMPEGINPTFNIKGNPKITGK